MTNSSAWWPPGRIEQPRRPVTRQPVPLASPVAEPEPKRIPVAEPPRAVATAGWRGVALVDLHSHVLPGVDDGADSPATSLEMLRLAAADGAGAIVATPHAARCELRRIRPAVDLLNRLARENGLAIRILPGSEVALSDLAGRPDDLSRFQSMNDTPYLLLELPLAGEWPERLEEVIFHLQVAGCWPILAHAERYPAVQRDPAHLDNLIERGVLIQLNADSILGRRGRHARQTAETLLRRGMAHLVASDTHDASHRPPGISQALDHISEMAGPETAIWIAGNASAVIDGRTIDLAPQPAVQQQP